MNYMSIGIDHKNLLSSLGKSSDLLKVTTESTDNLMQHSEHGVVLIDELTNSLYVMDSGSGFYESTWEAYHNLGSPPVNSSGASKYGIGSKLFFNSALERRVVSFNSDKELFSSCWKAGELSWNHLSDDDANTLFAVANEFGVNLPGTIVQFKDIDYGSFKKASSFYSKVCDVFSDRYAQKLFQKNTSIEVIYRNKKEIQSQHIQAKNIKETMELDTARSELYKGAGLYTWVDSVSPPRSVGTQGTDVYYDGIKIVTLPWSKYTSKKGLVTRPSHNNLNSVRQAVFLTPKSALETSCEIGLNKTECTLCMEIRKILAADLDKIISILKAKNAKAFAQNPVAKTSVAKFPYTVCDRSGKFANHDMLDVPFSRNNKTNEVVVNADTNFYQHFKDKNSREREFLVKLIDSMYETYDAVNNKMVVNDYMKRFLVQFEAKLR